MHEDAHCNVSLDSKTSNSRTRVKYTAEKMKRTQMFSICQVRVTQLGIISLFFFKFPFNSCVNSLK